MNDHSFSLAQDMELAFNSIGESMMKDDFACKLLAYTYCIGGEITVLHSGMNAGIAIASAKLNIRGGERPHAHLMKQLQIRIKNMEVAIYGFDSSPTMQQLTEVLPWLQEIWDRYEIKDLMSKPFSQIAQRGKKK